MRGALYARFSSANQKDSSIADQLAECKRFATSKDWTITHTATDAEESGASRLTRPGLLGLLDSIAEWDVLVVLDASRLARNPEDMAWVLNRLKFHGRQCFAASTGGDLASLEGQILGVISAHDLEKLRTHTSRALRGRISRGHAAGPPPYGYRTEADGDERKLVVDSERAAIVERIFALYAAGHGIKAIAHKLNAHATPAPRSGRSWAPTAVREMLRNETYTGRVIWGRSTWRKDPDTGRRVRFERPATEWSGYTDESLRIIGPELWDAVQARLAERGATMRRSGGRKVPKAVNAHRRKHLLSGLLECAECGGGFFDTHARNTYGCS